MKSREDNLLAFVKAIKDLSGLGLKEAKDLADSMRSDFSMGKHPMRDIYISKSDDKSTFDRIKLFKDRLRENCTGLYEVTGMEWERQVKLLSLGVGEDIDYRDFISEYIVYTKNTDELKSSLNTILSHLDRDKLVKIYEEIRQNESYLQ